MKMANRRVQLYYFPASYYSQRVLIALNEKEVKYEPVVVDIHSGEQNQAWYLRINSSGAVPVLQDGEKIIKESETIVDYIDKAFPSDSNLVPDMSTELGKEVNKWRKIVEELNIFGISYGVMCHPELSVSGLKAPKSLLKTKTEVIANFQIAAKKLEQLADEHPDLRDEYMNKAAAIQKRVHIISNKENVLKALDEVEEVLEKVENQLKKVEADPSKELWFCGQQFTAADINLCVLLGRLQLLGLCDRYFNVSKKPYLYSYWEQAKKRPTIRRFTVNMAREMFKRKLLQKAKIVLPIVGGVVSLGLAVGLAYMFTQKR